MSMENKAPSTLKATENARDIALRSAAEFAKQRDELAAALVWHTRVEAAARAMLDNEPFMAKHDGCTADTCHVMALYDVLREKADR